MGAFTFSPEEGTAAYSLPDRVDENTVLRRYNELMSLQRSISERCRKERSGKVVRVMVDEYDPADNMLTGRLSTQAPDIDGSVILDGIEAKPGDIMKVRITGATDYDLIGGGALTVMGGAIVFYFGKVLQLMGILTVAAALFVFNDGNSGGMEETFKPDRRWYGGVFCRVLAPEWRG